MGRYRTVAVIGVGLIGGSVGMALRRRKLADKVIGVGRRQTSLRTARRVGSVDHTTVDLSKGVAKADLVVVCSPAGLIVEHALAVAEHCPPDTLITDVGSTKQSIVETLNDNLARGCRFLGSHPLAGSERSGPSHADAELFEGRVAIITPTRNTRAEDFDHLEQFWSDLGSVVVQMAPDEHDHALALSSHLPHAVAASLAATLPEKYFRLAGSGFHDTTRVASGGAELWQQIFSMNRDNLLVSIEQFEANLLALKQAVAQDDVEAIQRILTNAKKNSDALGS